MSESVAFWGELSPCEHVVQIYESDNDFLATLADFIGTGIISGHACAVIATPQHRRALDERLNEMGIEVNAIKSRNRLISVDAEETISKFFVDGWPNERLFNGVITGILQRARNASPKIRVFGEMVALMWAAGYCGATVKLEHMWTELCRRELFPLFCAYPRTGFTEKNASESLKNICSVHSQTQVV